MAIFFVKVGEGDFQGAWGVGLDVGGVARERGRDWEEGVGEVGFGYGRE